MLKINLEDKRLKYPGFYNISPIKNEISFNTTIQSERFSNGKILLDEQYGRIINSNFQQNYGASQSLSYYKAVNGKKVIQDLRVPFRKIPIFEFEDIENAKLLISEIESENPDYDILLRGQSNLYKINRSEEENQMLFGERNPIEPSFQASFVRSNFNEFFIYNLWHCQTALLLEDLKIDLAKLLSNESLLEFKRDCYHILNSPHFTPISLGFAQHYGLPSVGLDLTKDFEVASWFATHMLKIDENGGASTEPIKDFKESTVYIFRCPKDSVFSYKDIKPKFIENTRPDRQDAWFGHAGWGNSKNQMASYLVCGIRLNESVLNGFREGFENHLFPQRDEDLVLEYFLNIKCNSKYKGEVERAFRNLYYLKK
ncbi:FRG domain-containing protein [Labilibaculum euxinus]